uniref:Uncharacterized protein n=1 Tax=viral metagenome TaxID=1070528 RepID=A0A6C0JMJ9_9ZZZZ
MTKPSITKFNEFKNLRDYSYTINEIKDVGKKFGVKFKQKKKKELEEECYYYLKSNHSALKIQKLWANYFIRLFNKSQGPAFIKRETCNNVEDFLTTETMKEIDYYLFFSFKDTDGFNYGFNLISIYNLIIKKDTKNPYTRNYFSVEMIELVHRRLLFNKILKQTHHDIYNPSTTTINNKILSLFQKIDSLGNYTQTEWLTSLSPYHIRRFLLELYDIWEYRAQLTKETKLLICPPNGTPFREIPIHIIQTNHHMNTDILKQFCINIINQFINTSPFRENQSLGAIYILSALTLVSPNAAESMPWLYQAVL